MKLQHLLNEIESTKEENLKVSKLPLLLQEINKFLSIINKCENIKDANIYFDKLQDAQSSISKLIFKDHITVSDSLWKFFKDFDRIDDHDLRIYLFNKIKKNEYTL